MTCDVQTFCFRFTLRQGAIVASVITTIDIIINAVIGILALQGKLNEASGGAQRMTGEIMLSFFCILLISLGFLNFALVTNKLNYLMPWLVIFMVKILLALLMGSIDLIYGGSSYIAIIFVITPFYFYLWIVVYNHYREMDVLEPAYLVL